MLLLDQDGVCVLAWTPTWEMGTARLGCPHLWGWRGLPGTRHRLKASGSLEPLLYWNKEAHEPGLLFMKSTECRCCAKGHLGSFLSSDNENRMIFT